MTTRGLLDAQELARHSVTEATDFAQSILESNANWQSPLVSYRLASEFQKGWKVEAGHWLLFAEQTGFLPALRQRIQVRVRRMHAESLPDGRPDPNDPVHHALQAELAPAMVAYYLSHAGWQFVDWDVRASDGRFDVDVRMRTPDGALADIQVKASDRLGRIVDRRIVDGEVGAHVIAAIAGAAEQLEAAPGPIKIVAVSAQRTPPLSRSSFDIAGAVFGRTVQDDTGAVSLVAADRRLFASAVGSTLTAVILLDFIRWTDVLEMIDYAQYGCTVFLNPWTASESPLRAADFPYAAVCALESGAFVWHGDPGECFVVPTGTRYVSEDAGA